MRILFIAKYQVKIEMIFKPVMEDIVEGGYFLKKKILF